MNFEKFLNESAKRITADILNEMDNWSDYRPHGLSSSFINYCKHRGINLYDLGISFGNGLTPEEIRELEKERVARAEEMDRKEYPQPIPEKLEFLYNNYKKLKNIDIKLHGTRYDKRIETLSMFLKIVGERFDEFCKDPENRKFKKFGLMPAKYFFGTIDYLKIRPFEPDSKLPKWVSNGSSDQRWETIETLAKLAFKNLIKVKRFAEKSLIRNK